MGEPPADELSRGSNPEAKSENALKEQILHYAEDLRKLRYRRRSLAERIRNGQEVLFTILIVDDQKHVRDLVAASLGTEHYQLVEATRGTEAIVLARAKLPALIILDWRMPHLDGIEVCRMVRADSALQNVPIVMLTSARNAEERRIGMEAGASAYLVKPFSPTELLDVVERLLHKTS